MVNRERGKRLRGLFDQIRWLLVIYLLMGRLLPGQTGTWASLRGVHATQEGTIWASGTDGVILRGNGMQWTKCETPAGAGKLDFRAVWAWDGQHALAMSSGPGADSRLYETTDGCASWRLLFQNPDARGFWDGLVFEDKRHGWLLGDPVNGRFTIFRTKDAGKHWERDQSPALSADIAESVFAASNSALTAFGHDVWFVTGGAAARVFHCHHGRWTVAVMPLRAGKATAGAFSVAFSDSRHGVAVGGDYKDPDLRSGTAAFTADGGKTWHAPSVPPSGYRSAVAWSDEMDRWIAAGPNGVDVSKNGKTWRRLPHVGGNALSPPWLVGGHGEITHIGE